ncbi:MAG TPA: iron uptake system protein EfeO [Streptosporangiaceae bacterium]|jgi:iron uptake system component EfeO
MRPVHPIAFAGVTVLSISMLTGCGKGDDAGASDAGAVEVTAADTSCEVAKKQLPAGSTTFKVTNRGSQATELEILKADGKVVSERENIGPGTGAELTVQLSAGTYKVLCSPGMTGKGPTQDITVTGTGAKADPRLDKAVADYRVYVSDQVDDTLATAKKFVAAVKVGDIAGAKALYAPSRVGWESIEPVAESFGDIDPKVDLREADLEQGQKWTGWHVLEKALWKTGSVKGQDKIADQLITDLEDLKKRVGTADITPTSMGNGAKELLDEVATGKVTGEEEAFSHTDLVDFKANVDGAKKVYELLKPVVQEKDPALAKNLDEEFASVEAQLAKYKKGDGYVSYDTVGKAQRKELSDAVNALGEPLSKLAGAVA